MNHTRQTTEPPKEKTCVIIQARMTSSRLPGKVLRPVLGHPMLDYMIDRLSRMTTIDSVKDIIIATTTNATDDCIEALALQKGARCFRGSEEDVLDRVLQAAHTYNVDVIIETTADCPLIDPVESDKVVQLYRQGGFDYVSNVLKRTYPRGMDTQVFSTKTLEDVARRTSHPVDHEHVSYYIYQHPEIYRLGNILAPPELDRADLRLTVDTFEDFALVREILETFEKKHPLVSLSEIIQFLNRHPELPKINQEIQQKKIEYESVQHG